MLLAFVTEVYRAQTSTNKQRMDVFSTSSRPIQTSKHRQKLISLSALLAVMDMYVFGRYVYIYVCKHALLSLKSVFMSSAFQKTKY
jgi:hypothetical protein